MWIDCRFGIWRLNQLCRGCGIGSGIVPQEPLLLPFPIPFLHRFTFVVHLLAASQCQLNLRPPTGVEVDRQGDEVRPWRVTAPFNLAISRLRSSNLRGRRGS